MFVVRQGVCQFARFGFVCVLVSISWCFVSVSVCLNYTCVGWDYFV